MGHVGDGDTTSGREAGCWSSARFAEGKKQPVILDLVDNDAIFQGFHLSRLKQYYALGAEVVKV